LSYLNKVKLQDGSRNHIWLLTRHFLIIVPVLLFFCAGCMKSDNPGGGNLILVAFYPFTIPETSGLTYYDSDNRLLTVSDLTGRVYVISTAGEVLDSLAYQGKDPEGIAYDRMTSRIFIVEEKSNEVVVLDTLGNEINRFEVELSNLIPRHGLEGITVNTETGNLLLVSEKFPGLLIEVTMSGEEVRRHDLNFAKDYSSVFFHPSDKSLWILSDESQSLTLCTLNGERIKTWQTGIKKGEGVVIDSKMELIYIVTDNDSGLYVFKMVRY
jgi:uncharacterized protein YjiK